MVCEITLKILMHMYIEAKSYMNSYLKKMCTLSMYLEYNLMGC